jgi:hypothetical protein
MRRHASHGDRGIDRLRLTPWLRRILTHRRRSIGMIELQEAQRGGKDPLIASGIAGRAS